MLIYEQPTNFSFHFKAAALSALLFDFSVKFISKIFVLDENSTLIYI